MKLIEATVLGNRVFQSKKNGQMYNVAYVSFELPNVSGLATAEVFTASLVSVGTTITGCYDGFRFKELEMA